MKPRVKAEIPVGDATCFTVTVGGRSELVMVSAMPGNKRSIANEAAYMICRAVKRLQQRQQAA